MTRRRRTPIENALQNGNHADDLSASNSPNHSSAHTIPNANRSFETQAFSPMTRQLLDILAVIALRKAVKKQQQEKHEQ